MVLSDVHVTFNELVRLLSWVYRIYYPGKKRLNAGEKREVVEKLMEWWMTDAFPPEGTGGLYMYP